MARQTKAQRIMQALDKIQAGRDEIESLKDELEEVGLTQTALA